MNEDQIIEQIRRQDDGDDGCAGLEEMVGMGSDLQANQIDPMESMKQMLVEIKVECKRVKDGCTFTQVSIADIDTHEKDECEFRMVKCDRVGCQLAEEIPWNLLTLH